MVVMIVVLGDIGVALFVLGVVVVFGVVPCSCYCSRVLEVVVSRVCLVALPSNLFRYSKYCLFFVCVLVLAVLCLHCDCFACLCACLMACSLAVVIVIVGAFIGVVAMVAPIVLASNRVVVIAGMCVMVVFGVVVLVRFLVLVLLKWLRFVFVFCFTILELV